MKQITFSDKQFYDLLQFTSEYTGNILERASEDWDSSYSQDLLEAAAAPSLFLILIASIFILFVSKYILSDNK